MSSYILLEAALAAKSFLLGLLLMISYDFLRLFRFLIPHGNLWIGMEDMGYWIYCAVMTIRLLFEENDGNLRGYVIGCAFFAMFLYDRIVSRRVFEVLKNIRRCITMKKRDKIPKKGARNRE